MQNKTKSRSANYISMDKKKELEEELEDLKGPRRRAILESLEYAKSLGDLSENAEYHQAREDQGKLEERIAKIESILNSAEVVEATGGGETIEVGSTVIVEKQGTSGQHTYLVVGAEEADMQAGKISNLSPFGSAIFGKKKGDKVSFKTPSGEVNYKIIDVS